MHYLVVSSKLYGFANSWACVRPSIDWTWMSVLIDIRCINDFICVLNMGFDQSNKYITSATLFQFELVCVELCLFVLLSPGGWTFLASKLSLWKMICTFLYRWKRDQSNQKLYWLTIEFQIFVVHKGPIYLGNGIITNVQIDGISRGLWGSFDSNCEVLGVGGAWDRVLKLGHTEVVRWIWYHTYRYHTYVAHRLNFLQEIHLQKQKDKKSWYALLVIQDQMFGDVFWIFY